VELYLYSPVCIDGLNREIFTFNMMCGNVNNLHQARAVYRMCGISQYMQGGYAGHAMYNSATSCLLQSNVRSDKHSGSCGLEAVVRVLLGSAPFLFTCSPNKIVGTGVSGTSQYQI
jgi:hypothetical protein